MLYGRIRLSTLFIKFKAGSQVTHVTFYPPGLMQVSAQADEGLISLMSKEQLGVELNSSGSPFRHSNHYTYQQKAQNQLP